MLSGPGGCVPLTERGLLQRIGCESVDILVLGVRFLGVCRRVCAGTVRAGRARQLGPG